MAKSTCDCFNFSDLLSRSGSLLSAISAIFSTCSLILDASFRALISSSGTFLSSDITPLRVFILLLSSDSASISFAFSSEYLAQASLSFISLKLSSSHSLYFGFSFSRLITICPSSSARDCLFFASVSSPAFNSASFSAAFSLSAFSLIACSVDLSSSAFAVYALYCGAVLWLAALCLLSKALRSEIPASCSLSLSASASSSSNFLIKALLVSASASSFVLAENVSSACLCFSCTSVSLFSSVSIISLITLVNSARFHALPVRCARSLSSESSLVSFII